MATVAQRITALIKEGLYECPDDYWRMGTEHDAHREYNAATRDRLITTARFGVGRGKRLHLACLGLPLYDQFKIEKETRPCSNAAPQISNDETNSAQSVSALSGLAKLLVV